MNLSTQHTEDYPVEIYLAFASAAQIRKMVPSEWLPYYPGKKITKQQNWMFYIQDGFWYDLKTRELQEI